MFLQSSSLVASQMYSSSFLRCFFSEKVKTPEYPDEDLFTCMSPKKSRSRRKNKTESRFFHTEQQEHPELPHQHNFQAHHGMHHGIGNVHHFTHMAQRQGCPRFHTVEQFPMYILPGESPSRAATCCHYK